MSLLVVCVTADKCHYKSNSDKYQLLFLLAIVTNIRFAPIRKPGVNREVTHPAPSFLLFLLIITFTLPKSLIITFKKSHYNFHLAKKFQDIPPLYNFHLAKKSQGTMTPIGVCLSTGMRLCTESESAGSRCSHCPKTGRALASKKQWAKIGG